MSRTSSPLLLPLFRSQAQARLLTRIYLGSDRPAPLASIANELGLDRAGVKREVDRLEQAGLVTTHRLGRQRLVQPNPHSPYYGDLFGLLMTAFGPSALVARALSGIAGIERAFLFGSWAARYSGEPGVAPGDIDVLIVGTPDRSEVYRAAGALSDTLRRAVNPTIVSPERWETSEEGFMHEVKSSALVALDLAADA